MEDDHDEDMATFFEAAGFSTTPPRDTHVPLDTASLRAKLEALVAIGDMCEEDDDDDERARTDLSAPWSESDLLRAYSTLPCETLIITFGGLTQGFPGVATPGRAQHEFVGACRRIGVLHALFVRDPLQSWYLRSTGTLIEPFTSLLALLRREVSALRPARIVTIGASMGGYAAIRAGCALGAHTCIALGPQIFLHPCERRQLALPFAVMDPPLMQLERDARRQAIRLERQSLVALLAGGAACSHVSCTRIVMHVGDWPKGGDIMEARLLQEATLPIAGLTVDVHLHARHGHNLAFTLRESGWLEPLLTAHLQPLGATQPSARDPLETLSVNEVVARENRGEAPPATSSSNGGAPRPVLSKEAQLENVRRVNAGLSVWCDRDVKDLV